MPLLDEILNRPTDTLQLSTKLQRLYARISEEGKPDLEVVRADTDLGAASPKTHLRFPTNGCPAKVEVFDWDDEMNAGLIQRGVRAVNTSNESDRFALTLHDAMRKTVREYGDGFFNAVLFELVTESDLHRYPEIAEVLSHAYALEAPRDSRRYGPCRDAIAAGIYGRMVELEKPLGYHPDVARTILTTALARFLDKRFTVSSRRRLGLL